MYALDAGMLSSASVPESTSLEIANSPPTSLARSRLPGKPKCPAGSRPDRIAASMPFPSSRTRKRNCRSSYLHRIPAFDDRLCSLHNPAVEVLLRLDGAVGPQLRGYLKPWQQSLKTLQECVVQVPREAGALTDAFFEKHVELRRQLPHPQLMYRP